MIWLSSIPVVALSPCLPASPTRRFWRSALSSIPITLALLIGPVVHADDDADGDDRTLQQKAATRFPQPIKVGALLNRTVLEPLESQPKLGTVKAIVRAKDKSIEAVIDYGGYFGIGTKPITVPIEAMTLLGQYMEIVDFSPDELDAFPKYDSTGMTPLSPSEIIRVGLSKPSH